jgi:cell division protein DivIC
MSLAIPQKWLKFKYMRFLNIINQKKFTLISVFLLLYVTLNLLDGERGLISFYKKQIIIEQLQLKESLLKNQLNEIKRKNNLLTDVVDLDYLETLYRKKFMVGKVNEKVYVK